MFPKRKSHTLIEYSIDRSVRAIETVLNIKVFIMNIPSRGWKQTVHMIRQTRPSKSRKYSEKLKIYIE